MLAFYYLAYRYPLQIGRSLTSPTYTDTPPALQTGKYVLIVAILLIVATAAAVRGPLGERTRDAHPLSSWALLFLSIFAILKGLFAGAVDRIIVGLDRVPLSVDQPVLRRGLPVKFPLHAWCCLSSFAVRSEDPASGFVTPSHSTVQSIRATALSTPKGIS